jgi:small-conductance mechanosensitive channel
VLFTDFGNSALMFKTYFWIQLSEEINPLIVESDVRFRIDELFRDTGIVIAFPQLDIHLDAQDPMGIKIIDSQKVETNKTDRK